MNHLSVPNAYPQMGHRCPFADQGYQVMRNIAAAAQYALTEGKGQDWRVVFSFPPDRTTDAVISHIQERLQDEHRKRVLKLDYMKLAKVLAVSEDDTARGLAAHMANRLGISLSANGRNA